MIYNVLKLHGELLAAGLPIVGVAEDGRIDWEGIPTQEQLDAAAVILAAHDPTDFEAPVQAGAEAQVAAIPNWATWTEAEVLAWLETNVKTPLDAAATLARAKAVLQVMYTVMRAQSRMLVGLRNARWPHLQDSD